LILFFGDIKLFCRVLLQYRNEGRKPSQNKGVVRRKRKLLRKCLQMR
jgi:hypothetical protein